MSEHNAVMTQFFHWYTSGDGNFWAEAEGRAAKLATPEGDGGAAER